MTEQLILESKSREERYRELYPQLRALLSVETDRIANLANMAAALRQTFGFFWVGFYLVSERELVLGPFQGDLACTRIPYGRGVCGDAWAQGQTLVVPDVESYPGHIACSSLSRSEVVVPIYDRSGEIMGVLDIDSQEVGDFSEELDRPWLELYVGLLAPLFP